MTEATPYSIPPQPGRWRAFALALVVHLALVGVLWFSVHWQSETPVAIEAEIWSPQVQDAAPPPPPEAAEPEVKPPAPEPEPAPTPPPPPPKPVIEPPAPKPVVKPDIALAQEKKRKEKLQKELQEEERARLEKQLAEKKRQEKVEKEKADAKAKKRAEEEQKKRDEAERKKREEAERKKREEAEQKKLADAKKKLAEEKQRNQERSEQAARDKARNEDLKRMMAQAGSGGSGDAPKSQGQRGDPGYGDKIKAKIRSNTIFNVPANLTGNHTVEYAVELLPDGSIRKIRKIKSSGIPGFDEAVYKGIEKSQPFPPDKTGSVPKDEIIIAYNPKDQ